MNVDNAEDVKVYTVGPNFTHAETRKYVSFNQFLGKPANLSTESSFHRSPVVDGHVKRNTDGKEIRYCVELTPEEKEMARKLSVAFGQTICGFDLLRVNGKSYVIDVNGWSFVKGSESYYDNCARILSDAFKRSVSRRNSIIDIPPEISPEHSWRLKGFVAVLRHADRTPKQKFKIYVTSKPFVDLLQGSDKEVVFRQKHQLAEFQSATVIAKNELLEDKEKLDAILEILNKKSEMPGTKVQLKPYFEMESGNLIKIQLIVKWGGEFTHAGLHQARDFGINLRKDMIIMNRNLLQNNVKIYSSSERRVRATGRSKNDISKIAPFEPFISVLLTSIFHYSGRFCQVLPKWCR
jgi:inositol-hexakisphosphate/diphosphoinositol-pentakisphosphate 1-kinase